VVPAAREQHTKDRSGFDIATLLRMDDASHVLVTIEVKYVDSFSSVKLDPQRYTDSLKTIGLSATDASDLSARGASQFLRSVLLTHSVQRRGIAGASVPKIDSSLAVVLGRDDDRSAARVVDEVGRAQNALLTAFGGTTSSSKPARPEMN
jgi:hypothetical protein